MKTPDLSLVIDEFVSQQDEVIRHWTAQFNSRQTLGRSDLLHACTLALMSSASNWELFRSNWHIRAVAADATQLKKYLETRIVNSAAKDLRDGLKQTATRVEVHLATHPTLAVATALLDASERNMTFNDKNDSIDKSAQHLVAKYAQKVDALNDDDWKLLRLVIAIRNAIAHGSNASVLAMNEAAAEMTGASDKSLRSLARPKNRITREGIGAYLHSRVDCPGDYPDFRVILLCLHLKDIAQKFRV